MFGKPLGREKETSKQYAKYARDINTQNLPKTVPSKSLFPKNTKPPDIFPL